MHEEKPSEISRVTIWRPDETFNEDDEGKLVYKSSKSLEINEDIEFYMGYDPVR